MSTTLVDLFAARTGHFCYESGHHGRLWLDLDALFLRANRMQPFADELAQRLAAHRPDVICGPLVGGAFLAQTVAAALAIEFAFAERVVAGGSVAYRIPAGLRPALADKCVAVVDDVINAGSAVRATVASLEACGASVVAVGALLVLGDAARVWPLESLATVPNVLWPPAECPLCAAGRPLDEIPTW